MADYHHPIIKELLMTEVDVGLTLKDLAGFLHVVYVIPDLGWLEQKTFFHKETPTKGFVLHYGNGGHRTAVVTDLEKLVRVHHEQSSFGELDDGDELVQPASGWGPLYERFGLAVARTQTYYMPING